MYECGSVCIVCVCMHVCIRFVPLPVREGETFEVCMYVCVCVQVCVCMYV